ncbi:MAG: hypothetical protein CVU57_04365 [Deltaproteobacteria bacterium HGW-Deltaproteobacteria-15]|nr:MAG: hypothetical protein CVU57_04365 [Deltaproteobacteria bacterium HGW-Deltaproteobacteria-15]
MITGIRIHCFIGGMELLRAPRIWIESERHKALSRAGITLPDPKGEIWRMVSTGGPVEIRYGYRDDDPATWKGTVAWKRPGTEDQVEIGAVGVELPLSATRITQAWENETPEAIIRWAVGRAGMAAGRIDSPGVVFPRFVASNINVWQTARQCAHTCQRSFGLDMSRWALWAGADGAVNWGDFDEPGLRPRVATGAGLINHSPATDAYGRSIVETFLIAGFMHSQIFRLLDTRRDIDDELRALRVRHELNERSVRTFIRYGDEHERF